MNLFAYMRTHEALHNPTTEKDESMNYNTLVFILNPKVKAVRATYQDGEKAELFKTFDDTLKVDDFALVETNTRHGMTVVKITEIDAEVDLETTTPIRWLINKVDVDALNNLKAAEDGSIKGVRKIELDKKREQMAKALSEDSSQLAALPLSTIPNKSEAE